MLADNSIRFQPVKVQKNKILRHKLLHNLPQKYKFSVHPICTALKKPPVLLMAHRFKKQTNQFTIRCIPNIMSVLNTTTPSCTI